MNAPNTIAIAAKSEAPAVIPIKSGVASGFLNIPCKQVPETAKALPMRIAITIRESLMSKKTYWSVCETEGFSPKKLEMISEKELLNS